MSSEHWSTDILLIYENYYTACDDNCIQGYFPIVLFLPLNTFSQTRLFIKEMKWKTGIRPLLLNSTADNEDERGENKTGANTCISLYTVCHCYWY